MKRLEIVSLFKIVIGDTFQCLIRIPRTISVFGQEFTVGVKKRFFITDLSKEVEDSGIGMTVYTRFKSSYSVRFNSMGVLTDLIFHKGSNSIKRIPQEDFDDHYGDVMNDLMELDLYLRTKGAVIITIDNKSNLPA